jgi:hypothetical protein
MELATVPACGGNMSPIGMLAYMAGSALILMGCSEKHSGTRVGTETVINAKVIGPDGKQTSAHMEIYRLPSDALPWNSLPILLHSDSGSTIFYEAHSTDTVSLALYSVDSSLALWKRIAPPSTDALILDSTESLDVRFVPEPGSQYSEVWYTFPEAGLSLQDSSPGNLNGVSLEHVPIGPHQLVIDVRSNSPKRFAFFGVSPTAVQIQINESDLVKAQLENPNCVFVLDIHGNLMRDSVQNVLCN